MTKLLIDWLEHRTGYRSVVSSALYEHIPGGARWRYVWGSTLVFAFAVQVITGFFLWAGYSPSAQTAWESVYYIQYQMAGGWLLRGIHHFMAQAMIVLLVLHLAQVIIDGAYRAPREINFWIGLVLMQVVLGLALTGYLLPWDQKGYWATQVATNIMGIVPGVGPSLQRIVIGGSDYGHLTLTRFFALHAGLLPFLMMGLIAVHIYVFRRHGITVRKPLKGPDGTFWVDQVLKDAIACLVVLAVVLFLIFWPWMKSMGAVPAHQVDVRDGKGDQAGGQQEHVRRVPAHQRQRAEVGTAFHHVADEVADEGRASRDVQRDRRRPVRLLIPRQQVSGQREAENDEQEQDADHPVQLARLLV
jgi:quinol-cytochrome oxidoreductase complex cytochrome b subunit